MRYCSGNERLLPPRLLIAKRIYNKTCLSSMIPSAGPTVPPVAIIIITRRLLCSNSPYCENWGQTENKRENNDHYWPGLWVGQVDQSTLDYLAETLIKTCLFLPWNVLFPLSFFLQGLIKLSQHFPIFC